MRLCFFHRWVPVSTDGAVQVGDLGTLNAAMHSFRACERCGKFQMFMGENWYTVTQETP